MNDHPPHRALKAHDLRVFSVVRNALNGEAGIVMSVSGDRVELKDKTGAVARYKFGPHFSLVDHDAAVEFRAEVRKASALKTGGAPKKRSKTLAAFLNKLAKKR